MTPSRQVITWPTRTSRNKESMIYSDDDVEPDDKDLDGEVEDVETRLGLIPRGIVCWTRCYVVCAYAERCSQAEQCCCCKQYSDLGSEAAATKLFHFVGKDNATNDEGNGHKGNDGEIGLTVELNIAVDALGVVVERVEGLHRTKDEHEYRHYYECITRHERS